MTPIISHYLRKIKGINTTKKVLLILLFVFGSAKYSEAKEKSLDELKKEMLYIVVPENWDTSKINPVFGRVYVKLDMKSVNINNDVHRIGIDINCEDKLPFIAKHYPNVQQLLINSQSKILPEGISDFKNLRSLDLLQARYVEDDVPLEYDYNLPLLMTLPKLEEENVLHPFYFPEKLRNHPDVNHSQLTVIPLFFLQKGYDKNILTDLYDVPYPEIAAMIYAGCKMDRTDMDGKTHSMQRNYLFNSLAVIADYYEEFPDSLPLWFKGSENKHKPNFHRLPQNGIYSTTYSNGNTIISGNMVNGKPDGEWKLWYMNGITSEIRQYKNGVEEGKWIFFNQKGDTSSILFFKNEKVVRVEKMDYGSSLYNVKDNSWVLEKNTIDCDLDQQRVWYKSITHKKNDPKDSLTYYSVRYYENGMSNEEVKTFCGNKLIGSVITHEKHDPYPSNTFYHEKQTLNDKGKLMERWIYTNEFVLDSVWLNDGHLHSVALESGSPYRQNTISTWDSSGYLMSKMICTGRDTSQGQYTSYYKSGKVKRTSDYIRGKLDGQTILFYESGKKMELRYYENGVLDSVSTYNEAGKQTGAKVYENGALVKEYFYK